MQEPITAAFHCPSCGVLSQVGDMAESEVVCESCGYHFRRPIRVAPRAAVVERAEASARFVQRDVQSKRRLQQREKAVVPVAPAAPGSEDGLGHDPVGGTPHDDGSRKLMKRRRKRRHTTPRQKMFMAIWVFTAILGVITVREVLRRTQEPAAETEEEKAQRMQAIKVAEVSAFLDEHLVACREALRGYFAGGDTSERAQYVRDSLRVTPLMAKYFKDNLHRNPQEPIRLLRSGVRFMGQQAAIETLWVADDGWKFEAVFLREGGDWVLDWEEFVRFGTDQWHLFIARLGYQEGVFRVYARRRQVALDNDKEIILQFYPPQEDALVRQRGESPRIAVRSNSWAGECLRRTFAQSSEEPGLGESFFPERDPEDLHRMRVHLAWEENSAGEQEMVLKEVLAGGWWGNGLMEEFGNEEAAPGPEVPPTDGGD